MRTPKNWSRVSPENLARVSNLWPAHGDKLVIGRYDVGTNFNPEHAFPHMDNTMHTYNTHLFGTQNWPQQSLFFLGQKADMLKPKHMKTI